MATSASSPDWSSRNLRRLPTRWSLIASLIVLVILGFVLRSALASRAPSEVSRASAAALTDARTTMTWMQGPSVRNAHAMPLGHLGSGLEAHVSSPTRQDVNVPQMVRRYGAGRRIVLVVLAGVFNSLPPDEGVIVRGDVVAVVDARTNRVLLLTY